MELSTEWLITGTSLRYFVYIACSCVYWPGNSHCL